jgi:hypothetical protein
MGLLTVLLYVPGRKALQQVLPLALGASAWALQGQCTARADTQAIESASGSKADPASRHAVASDSRPEQPGRSLPNLMANLLGGNEFANVSK